MFLISESVLPLYYSFLLTYSVFVTIVHSCRHVLSLSRLTKLRLRIVCHCDMKATNAWHNKSNSSSSVIRFSTSPNISLAISSSGSWTPPARVSSYFHEALYLYYHNPRILRTLLFLRRCCFGDWFRILCRIGEHSGVSSLRISVSILLVLQLAHARS